ncbi:MAG: HDOD domain-containing protein [Kofleriaceae bacterium]|nr:HDOD domain-containing protein [Kofleriaceae bacterium]
MDLHAYVGRQAILDRRSRVVGYELLYRDSFENRARFSDVRAASATTMINAYLELGIDHLAGALPIWVNVPAPFLLGELPLLLPPERTVLEVLEDVTVTDELVAKLGEIRGSGFKIALDDFVLTDKTEPLVACADIIKLDIMGLSQDTIRERFTALRPRCATLLAEKVGTPEEHAFVHALGFELFQGFFYEKPVVTRGARMPHNRAALLGLLGRLYDPRTNYRDLEKLLVGELGLSVQLLKLASSVAHGGGAPLVSVAQAVARLGTAQVGGLVLLLVVAGFDDKPIELVHHALVRAKLCESLARMTKLPADELFTAGLLSLLDALVDQPLATIVEQLPVTDLIRDVVLARRDDAPARILAVARAQSRGDFDTVASAGYTPQTISTVWYDAVRWADEIVCALGR